MTQPKKKLATVKEVADHYRVSEKTVYRWVQQRTIEVARPGGGKSAIRIVLDERFSASPAR